MCIVKACFNCWDRDCCKIPGDHHVDCSLWRDDPTITVPGEIYKEKNVYYTYLYSNKSGEVNVTELSEVEENMFECSVCCHRRKIDFGDRNKPNLRGINYCESCGHKISTLRFFGGTG